MDYWTWITSLPCNGRRFRYSRSPRIQALLDFVTIWFCDLLDSVTAFPIQNFIFQICSLIWFCLNSVTYWILWLFGPCPGVVTKSNNACIWLCKLHKKGPKQQHHNSRINSSDGIDISGGAESVFWANSKYGTHSKVVNCSLSGTNSRNLTSDSITGSDPAMPYHNFNSRKKWNRNAPCPRCLKRSVQHLRIAVLKTNCRKRETDERFW